MAHSIKQMMLTGGFLNIPSQKLIGGLPLSSTLPQFNTKGKLLLSPQKPSVQHRKPFSSTHSSLQLTPQVNPAHTSSQTPSVQHTDHTFSASKIRELKTKNPSVQHTPQFNALLSSTHP